MRPFTPPSVARLIELGRQLGMDLTEDRASLFGEKAADLAFAYAQVDALDEWLPPVRTPRPARAELPTGDDPWNAWACRTSVHGSPGGPLQGRQVVVKDTLSVAGLPMGDGCDLLTGYRSEHDATVVERVLTAGAQLVGKANCEYLSYSSGSHTSVRGFVENPSVPGHSTGGSSSGCAALVAAGTVPMAIGGDQAGSIRIPAAHCGIHGLKPTWGRVPYTGAISSEYLIDHLGPMAASAADCALLLEAIAGPDPLDQRTAGTPPVQPYAALLEPSIDGLRIGVVDEGFGQRGGWASIDRAVRQTAERFAQLGADVKAVSVPWHRHGLAIWLVFAMEGYHEHLMLRHGFGAGQDGLCWSALNDALARWRDQGDRLPPNLQLGMLMGEHARQAHRRHYYTKACNLARRLRRAYDTALAEVDVLLMPTVCVPARPLPATPPDARQIIDLAFENIENTCPFNLSHHPALSMPCARVDGKPVGAMLVGRAFDEATLLRAAHAYSLAFDWHRIDLHEAASPASMSREAGR